MKQLVIVADDYGIGQETSQGILDLALKQRITGTVLMVNCPDAERAMQRWHRESPPVEMGWHPNLTLDQPISPPKKIPSLVQKNGHFYPLGAFLKRFVRGQIFFPDVLTEFRAQYRRYWELVGEPPKLINGHQHCVLFPPADRAILDLLTAEKQTPYFRHVCERWQELVGISGARIKRGILNLLGLRFARRTQALNMKGNRWLMGVTDPKETAKATYLSEWFSALAKTGDCVELCCHPGYRDESLIGRDCDSGAGLDRRTWELSLLQKDDFFHQVHGQGYRLTYPSQVV